MKPCASCGARRKVRHCYGCGFDTCLSCEHSCEVTHESLHHWLCSIKPAEPSELKGELPSGTYHRGVQRVRPSFLYEAVIAAAALILIVVLR